jgi:hypothetical protein
MRLVGEIEGGLYADEWQDIDEEELFEHLGVHNKTTEEAVHRDVPSDVSSSGSSHPERGSRSSASFSTNSFIRQRVRREILHHPVKVRRIEIPFHSDADRERLFERIASMNSRGEIPDGFGIGDGEDGDVNYYPIQPIHVGRGRLRKLDISLPKAVWLPRIRLWVQAVWQLTQFKEELGLFN